MDMREAAETENKGLENVVACTTEVSCIHDTTLLYRGYTIEDLSQHCSFEEVVYLLWNRVLPSKQELEVFQKELRSYLVIPKEIFPVLEQIAKTSAHSMAKLRTAVSYFGLLEGTPTNPEEPSPLEAGKKLTGAFGALVSHLSRLERNQSCLQPRLEKSLAWNFLYLIRGQEPAPEEEHLFDTALILHADHELNASTFTARVVTSTLSDYYSAITAALGSLKGPLHGGANEQVMKMLQEIQTFDRVDDFIEEAVQAKKKVMGIGHRVYKHGDPRAKILKELSFQMCQRTGLAEFHRMLVHIAEQMEAKKGLMPNVDFFSGLVYTALRLRPRDFTPIFATSRISGWTAQILEQLEHNRIYRPRARYVGPLDLRVRVKSA